MRRFVKLNCCSVLIVFPRYLVEFSLPDDKILPRDDISLDSGFLDDDTRSTDDGKIIYSVTSH